MSSLSSAKRKLNAKKVWIAQEVQKRKVEIAKKFVEDRVRTDKEFAQDVLNAVGENLPPEIKKAAEETIKGKETLPSEEDPNVTQEMLQEAIKKHCAHKRAQVNALREQSPELFLDKSQPLPEGAKPFIADGGCSPVDVSKEELQKTLEILSDQQTQRLKDAGLYNKETFVQSDGGGMVPMHETSLPDYPRDGE